MLKLRRLGPGMSAAAIGAVLTLPGAGIAVANSSSPAHPGASASTTRAATTCVSLWAVVNKAGKLQRAGCPGTTSAVAGTGYQVLFPRNVRDCAYVADAGNAGSKGVGKPAIATVAGRQNKPKGVFVQMYSPSGVGVRQGFHLIVACKQPKV
jgi:hypothetical protein